MAAVPALPLRTRARRARLSLLNIVKLVSGNRFTAPHHSDYTVCIKTPLFALRHYASAAPAGGSHILLVPPLMVTAEIYDMAPELSLVAWLRDQGHDVWGIDFGTPDPAAGSRAKDLADHVLSVSQAIDEVVLQARAPVHLLGYSQGGMFVYQVAAYRRCKDIASLITMGSPVDFLRNFPGHVHSGVWSNILQAGEGWIRAPLARLPGLPGKLASLGFKLASPRQELRHFLELLRFLDDEEAMKRLEPTRRFLGGEGFIAWPGPALRAFVDDFVVHNRMLSGGFVIAGQTLSLSDISVPVLYFVGRRDEFARPDSVRAIQRVVPHEELFGVAVDTGHLGLIVGTRAREDVWTTVHAWLGWRDGRADPPPRIVRGAADEPASKSKTKPGVTTLFHAAQRALWRQAGRVALDVTRFAHWTRWQLPRVLKLAQFWDSAPMSIGRTLAAQAQAIPERTFFLWEGRAYSYAEADLRVTRIAAALYHCGIRRGQPVGLLMENHPDCLTSLAALSRLGAVPVLINPNARGVVLQQAVAIGAVQDLILGPQNHTLREPETTRRLLIGTASRPALDEPSDGAIHLDRVRAELPADLPQNPGTAADIACLLFTSGTTGKPKAARISNRRWMMAATATSAGCDLTPTDTVYCCLPLHHGTGLLLAVGGALLGGCRLAIAPRFSTRGFWEDVRRTGSTVVFYVGELCRYLVAAPPSPLEKSHAVRLFVGNGMRADVWRELLHRFGRVSVLEFYGATEGNVVMTNLTGEKIGSIGRPPFALVRTMIAQYDPATERYARDARGFLREAACDQPGMLLVEIEPHNPVSRFDGYTDASATEAKILRNVVRTGDAWFCSGDLMRQDADGDHWFVDRVGDTFRWKGENVSTEQVSDVLSKLPFVAMNTVYGVRVPGQEGRAGMAAIVLRPGTALDPAALFQTVERDLIEAARPRFVRIVDELKTTESLKIIKHTLQSDGIEIAHTGPLYVYDKPHRTYVQAGAEDLEARLPHL